MVERFFIRPATVDRIRESWLGDAIQTYVTWLAEQSYSSRCVIRRVPLLVNGHQKLTHLGHQKLTRLGVWRRRKFFTAKGAPPPRRALCV